MAGPALCFVAWALGPPVTDAQVAEAWGVHLAMLLLLRERPDGDKRVRISRDNLAMARHCAAQGRLRKPCTQAALEPVMSRLATGVVGVSRGRRSVGV